MSLENLKSKDYNQQYELVKTKKKEDFRVLFLIENYDNLYLQTWLNSNVLLTSVLRRWVLPVWSIRHGKNLATKLFQIRTEPADVKCKH